MVLLFAQQTRYLKVNEFESVEAFQGVTFLVNAKQ